MDEEIRRPTQRPLGTPISKRIIDPYIANETNKLLIHIIRKLNEMEKKIDEIKKQIENIKRPE